MKVAVFGGTGFIGGYLTKALAERGHDPNQPSLSVSLPEGER